MPQYERKKLILVNVSNYGDRPTTITNLGYLYYASLWTRIRRRPDEAAIIPNPSDVHLLPYELKQGNLWSGIAIQDDQVTKWANEGRLYCVLYHSHSEQPIYRRVIAHARSNM